MYNEQNLRSFLKNSERRISVLLSQASRMRNTSHFIDAVETLESKIEDSKVHFYGTRLMQLGHGKSHLNIFLEVGNSYTNPLTFDMVEKIIRQLQEYFKAEFLKPQKIDPEDPNQILPLRIWNEPMRRLKTPALTLRVFLKKLQCDITFDSGLGVENTKLVHHLFSMQPEAFKLYHFVRIWIHIDEFAFKRYMVAILVIFYMQQKNLLPSVVDLQKNADENWIAGWNVGFDRKANIRDLGLESMSNYRFHLISFFHFYQNFDFANNVICPFLGRQIPIESFTNSHESFQKFQGNLKGFNFQPVNVADFFNLNFNVAFGVGKKRITKFVPFCGRAIEILREHLGPAYDLREE